ncbi:MAG: tRNA (guanine-N(1)-)-methyltransferase [Candidatus Dojkabacteria bacterium]|nr:MAG: tRNA (guanine-N(1)-)-methyltransferase [Candidatus Dojkabacteria bacterium]
MKFKTISIFPEFFEKSLDFSLIKKARQKGLLEIENYNLRNWSQSRSIHKQVDDRPFGGGPGMIMMVEPVYRALKDIKKTTKSVSIIFSPKGRMYDQTIAKYFACNFDEIILICPHYEGFDERILNFVDYELSIGDFILTGGEIPALIVIDSVSRLIPGVVGNRESLKNESFSHFDKGERNFEHPQYTRPAVFIDDEGNKYPVPEVLLSGNHRAIKLWRHAQSRVEKL